MMSLKGWKQGFKNPPRYTPPYYQRALPTGTPGTTALTVAQDQARQEEQASAAMSIAAAVSQDQVRQEEQAQAGTRTPATVAEDQARQEEQASAVAMSSAAVAEDQAVQEEQSTLGSGGTSTAISISQDQTIQEEAAVLDNTIPGQIPASGQYSTEPLKPRKKTKPAKPHHGLTIPEEWPEPYRQPVTGIYVHQDQAAQAEDARIDLGKIWTPFVFTPGITVNLRPPARPQPLPTPTTARRTTVPIRRPVPQRKVLGRTMEDQDDQEEAIAIAILTLTRR